MERLETRDAPAVFVRGGAFVVYGSNGADSVSVTQHDGYLDARDNLTGRHYYAGEGPITLVKLVGNGGDDYMTAAVEMPVDAWGGPGDDYLAGGSGADVLDGQGGDDVLFGGPGDDRLFGGYGDDRLYGSWGRDVLDGRPGTDYLRGGPDVDALYAGPDDTLDYNYAPTPAEETNPAAGAGPSGATDFAAKHARNVGRAQGAATVFLGDSITEYWQDYPSFAEYFGDPANCGLAGDTTRGLLWRIGHGEVTRAATAVHLLIGTNNLVSGYTPAQTAEGIRACAEAAQEVSPGCRVVVSAVLPRGAGKGDPLFQAAAATDAMIATLPGFVSAFDRFLTPGGDPDPALLPDLLHPNAAGYDVLGPLVRAALIA
jgi:lysophospholipase L1-like esterase